MVLYKYIVCIVTFLPLANTFGQSLDDALEDLRLERNIPGMAVGLVSNGELLYEGYFGMANIELEVPVSENTGFMLASVSKHYTHFGALMALDDGSITSFDDPVNDYLPFEVNHPTDNTAITIDQLINHTSSIRDNWDEMPYVSHDDLTIPLKEYLESYLVPDGEIYFEDLNFWPEGIGGEHYSNIGFALLGLVVESAVGMDFAQYMQEKLFDPLCMSNTSFLMEDLDLDKVAMPYNVNGQNFSPIGHYSYSDYPAGRLRSTVRDMANYAIACLNLGSMDDVTVLTPPVSYQIFNGHGGGDRGVTTGLSLDKNNKRATIIMINASGNIGDIASMMLDAESILESSGPDSLDCTVASNLEEALHDNTLLTLQNPVSQSLSLSDANIKGVSLWSLNNEQVYSIASQAPIRSVDLSHLQSGMYIIQCQLDNQLVHRQKLIVIND